MSAFNQVAGKPLESENPEDHDLEDLFDEGLADLQRAQNLVESQEMSYNGPIIGEEIESPFHKLFEELDRISIQSHHQTLSDGTPVSTLERSTIENLLLPGLNRHEMPSESDKTQTVRKADFNELCSFSMIETEALERALKLDGFEKLMKEKDPDNKEAWNFFDRTFVQQYS